MHDLHVFPGPYHKVAQYPFSAEHRELNLVIIYIVFLLKVIVISVSLSSNRYVSEYVHDITCQMTGPGEYTLTVYRPASERLDKK